MGGSSLRAKWTTHAGKATVYTDQGHRNTTCPAIETTLALVLKVLWLTLDFTGGWFPGWTKGYSIRREAMRTGGAQMVVCVLIQLMVWMDQNGNI